MKGVFEEKLREKYEIFKERLKEQETLKATHVVDPNSKAVLKIIASGVNLIFLFFKKKNKKNIENEK